jgi:hypothetical protein
VLLNEFVEINIIIDYNEKVVQMEKYLFHRYIKFLNKFLEENLFYLKEEEIQKTKKRNILFFYLMEE